LYRIKDASLSGQLEGLWLRNVEHCEWQGVICDNGVVVGLKLQDVSRNGTLATEIEFLRNFTYFMAGRNHLNGAIPSELAKLTKLEDLHLDHNKLSGTISSELAKLPKLKELHLCNNDLTGDANSFFCSPKKISSFGVDCGVVQCDCCYCNLALTGVASQSSEYIKFLPAKNAIDGNIGGPTAHTLSGYQEWWKVDLLKQSTILKIVVWNRPDCCKHRLSNSNVIILDETGTLIERREIGDASEKSKFEFSFDNLIGKTIKVQLKGRDYLDIAEVEVFGFKLEPINLKLTSTSSQLPTYENNSPAKNAIDGNIDGNIGGH